jgi:hypothetical protein
MPPTLAALGVSSAVVHAAARILDCSLYMLSQRSGVPVASLEAARAETSALTEDQVRDVTAAAIPDHYRRLGPNPCPETCLAYIRMVNS